MEKNTGIRIEATKMVNGRGDKGYEIKKIVALSVPELPDLYLETGPVVFLWKSRDRGIKVLKWERNGNIFTTKSGRDELCVGKFYTKETMAEVMAHIRAAGEHLADVNQALARKRAKWQGNVSFVDGVDVVAATTCTAPPPQRTSEDNKKIEELALLTAKVADIEHTAQHIVSPLHYLSSPKFGAIIPNAPENYAYAYGKNWCEQATFVLLKEGRPSYRRIVIFPSLCVGGKKISSSQIKLADIETIDFKGAMQSMEVLEGKIEEMDCSSKKGI